MLPHLPQLLESLLTATHEPQSVSPWLQVHEPATQACLARQTLLQVPQLALLVRMSTQRPAQKVWLEGLGHWQAPLLHCWEKGHTCDSGSASSPTALVLAAFDALVNVSTLA